MLSSAGTQHFLGLQCIGTEGVQLVSIHVDEASVLPMLHERLPFRAGGKIKQGLPYDLRIVITYSRMGQIHQAGQGRGLGEYAQLVTQAVGHELVGVLAVAGRISIRDTTLPSAAERRATRSDPKAASQRL